MVMEISSVTPPSGEKVCCPASSSRRKQSQEVRALGCMDACSNTRCSNMLLYGWMDGALCSGGIDSC